jgi:hypothetical protein
MLGIWSCLATLVAVLGVIGVAGWILLKDTKI